MHIISEIISKYIFLDRNTCKRKKAICILLDKMRIIRKKKTYTFLLLFLIKSPRAAGMTWK